MTKTKMKSARARGTGGLKKGPNGHYIARYQGADGEHATAVHRGLRCVGHR